MRVDPCTNPPDAYGTATLYSDTCFSPEAGVVACVYADPLDKEPQVCAYILQRTSCHEAWTEVYKECLPTPVPAPRSYEEKAEEFGL